MVSLYCFAEKGVPKVFTLASAAKPRNLSKYQRTMVYEALTPYPAKRSLEELAGLIERRCWIEYEARIKHPPLTHAFLRASIHWHLRKMMKDGIVKDDA
jgi:hypothetical protein